MVSNEELENLDRHIVERTMHPEPELVDLTNRILKDAPNLDEIRRCNLLL